MKLNEMALANASAILTGAVYLVCALGVALLPDFSKTLAESWFHGINLAGIWTGTPRGNFVVGLATSVAGTWLTGWAFAWVYNRLAK